MVMPRPRGRTGLVALAAVAALCWLTPVASADTIAIVSDGVVSQATLDGPDEFAGADRRRRRCRLRPRRAPVVLATRRPGVQLVLDRRGRRDRSRLLAGPTASPDAPLECRAFDCALLKDPRGGLLIEGSEQHPRLVGHLAPRYGEREGVIGLMGLFSGAVRRRNPTRGRQARLPSGWRRGSSGWHSGRSVCPRPSGPPTGPRAGGPPRALALTADSRPSAGARAGTPARRPGRAAVARDVESRPRVVGSTARHGRAPETSLSLRRDGARRQRQALPLRLRRRPARPLHDGHLRLRARAGPDKPARAAAADNQLSGPRVQDPALSLAIGLGALVAPLAANAAVARASSGPVSAELTYTRDAEGEPVTLQITRGTASATFDGLEGADDPDGRPGAPWSTEGPLIVEIWMEISSPRSSFPLLGRRPLLRAFGHRLVVRRRDLSPPDP